MNLGPGEPAAGPWRVEALADFAAAVTATGGRPRIVAVDGRGGGGKSSLAERLRAVTPGSVVVHTDDVAWHHSRFGWADLMADGILLPLRAGQDVSFRPPAWAGRGRDGSIDVPAGATVVFVEGVGASRRELTHLIDTAVWVQSDADEALRRALVRDMARDGTDLVTARREWDAWEVEEVPFLQADRPWDRARFVVAGTPELDHRPDSEVVTAPAFVR